jgi:hypothetical protein
MVTCCARAASGHAAAAEQRDELASPHICTQAQGNSIVSAQTNTLIGAQTGIKTIAAVHSQCR